jgi:hypothetical protein
MKKLALLALFATISAVSFGQTTTAQAQSGVALTVLEYVAIDFDSADPFLITIADGGQTLDGYTSSNSKMLTVRSNKTFSVACPSVDASGLTYSAIFTAFTGAVGTESQSVSAKVEGASLSTAPGSSYSATLTFTVTQN